MKIAAAELALFLGLTWVKVQGESQKMSTHKIDPKLEIFFSFFIIIFDSFFVLEK